VAGCAENTRDMRAQHLWGFPLYHPALLGFSILPPVGRKKVAKFHRYNRY